MLRIIFISLMFLHGLIHLLGFIKSINPEKISQLTQNISKPFGLLWLLATILFCISISLYVFKNDLWLLTGLLSIILSQILIFYSWNDAKFGSIPNLIILIVLILSWTTYNFESSFRKDVKENFEKQKNLKSEILTEADLTHLPIPVQKYLHYVGAVNKPKVKNFRIIFNGQMRARGQNFFDFVSEQYNFFDEPTRLFYMTGKLFGMEVPGYHRYINCKASMDIRLFGLISVIKKDGETMNKAETVTLFNDMCLLAPATLIDKKIKWETIDSTKVKAYFTNQDITISATLYFDNDGRLTNFSSFDRTDISDMEQYEWTTPVYEYSNFGNRKVISKGDAIWHYPNENFVYGKFELKSIEYNIDEVK